VDGVTIVVHQGVDVKGRVTIDGQPPAANSIRVSLTPDDSASRVVETQMANVIGQVTQYPPRIEPDGSFTIPVVPEGHYRLQVSFMSQAGNSYVADIRQSAASILDSGLAVGREAANPIEVQMSTNGATLEGNVLSADRKPAPAHDCSPDTCIEPASKLRPLQDGSNGCSRALRNSRCCAGLMEVVRVGIGTTRGVPKSGVHSKV
jgi:hypothetical protein